MKIDIEYTTDKERIKIVAKGIFCFCIYNINFSNVHDFIRHRIRCGKPLRGLRIAEYYPPEYLNKKPKKEKNKK